jgi:hypothetical protein
MRERHRKLRKKQAEREDRSHVGAGLQPGKHPLSVVAGLQTGLVTQASACVLLRAFGSAAQAEACVTSENGPG